MMMIGNFSINKDCDKFSLEKANPKAKRKFWALFNPYDAITECNKTIRDLKVGDTIKDTDGAVLKVQKIGGGAFFGKGSFSFQWICFYILNGKVN